MWIAPLLDPRYCVEGDHYSAWGRVKERIYPSGQHPADYNHYIVGRIGLQQSYDGFWKASSRESFEAPLPKDGAGDSAWDDPVALAMVALYEVLEWIHSLNEHLRSDGKYSDPADLDPDNGPVIDGLLAARHASHHGIRRIIGVAATRPVTYVVRGARWHLTDTADDAETHLSIGWLEDLPARVEASEQGGRVVRSSKLLQAYHEHLAGRDVRSSLGVALGFMLFTVVGSSPPANLSQWAVDHPPPIAP